MPKFYFHLRRGDVVYEDHEGEDLATVSEAVRHAVDDARAILRDEPEVPAATQWMEVVDPQGNTVRTVPFLTVQ